jgi:hypothetical protein
MIAILLPVFIYVSVLLYVHYVRSMISDLNCRAG